MKVPAKDWRKRIVIILL